MEIGNRIKTLRKNKGITQEQLAGHLGISFQAISRWENNIALPDITIIPTLADFFEVSIDDLFDYKKEQIKNEVELICQNAYQFREKNPIVARRILEIGLEKYPRNYMLSNHMLYVMENSDEIIETASMLVAECHDYEIRYDALRFLALAYKSKGEQKNAEAAVEQIPQLYFTKFSEAAFIYEGERKYEVASNQKWISLEIAIQMFVKIVEYLVKERKLKESISEIERVLRIIEILKGEKQAKNLEIYENYLRKIEEQLKTNEIE